MSEKTVVMLVIIFALLLASNQAVLGCFIMNEEAICSSICGQVKQLKENGILCLQCTGKKIMWNCIRAIWSFDQDYQTVSTISESQAMLKEHSEPGIRDGSFMSTFLEPDVYPSAYAFVGAANTRSRASNHFRSQWCFNFLILVFMSVPLIS